MISWHVTSLDRLNIWLLPSWQQSIYYLHQVSYGIILIFTDSKSMVLSSQSYAQFCCFVGQRMILPTAGIVGW